MTPPHKQVVEGVPPLPDSEGTTRKKEATPVALPGIYPLGATWRRPPAPPPQIPAVCLGPPAPDLSLKPADPPTAESPRVSGGPGRCSVWGFTSSSSFTAGGARRESNNGDYLLEISKDDKEHRGQARVCGLRGGR